MQHNQSDENSAQRKAFVLLCCLGTKADKCCYLIILLSQGLCSKLPSKTRNAAIVVCLPACGTSQRKHGLTAESHTVTSSSSLAAELADHGV